MTVGVYRITPQADSVHHYFVKAVSPSDALLTLTELGIPVYADRVIDLDVNPAGHHLIVSFQNRQRASRELREASKPTIESADKRLDPNDEAFKGTQANAILAGNMFIPGDEDEIPVIRTLLAATYKEEESAKEGVEAAKRVLEDASGRLLRARQSIRHTRDYLVLTVEKIAKTEAQK